MNLTTRRDTPLKTEEIIVIAIVVLLVLGFVLIFTGLKTSIIGGSDDETEDIKEDILYNLETVEKSLKEIDNLLGPNGNSRP